MNDELFGLPKTAVGISGSQGYTRFRAVRETELDPRTAAVLAAVLLASAEQVSAEKLMAFGVSSPTDLSLLGLAMAFRADDSGLMGDVFEWSLLSAVNLGEPEIAQMSVDALALAGVKVENPQAVLVAAEKGRLVEFSPTTSPTARVVTGRRGRPPLVSNVLSRADPTTWKADVLLGSDDTWITASLKSNPAKLAKSLKDSTSTPYPARIGITAVSRHRAGLVRDPDTDAVVMQVPVDGVLMALARSVLGDVKDAFAHHLNVPATPLLRDVSGIGQQLQRWRDRTVGYAVTTLLEVAEEFRLNVGEPQPTTNTAQAASDVLVAFDPRQAPLWLPREPQLHVPPRGIRHFDPID